jgi:hypothetical protein
VIPAPGDRDRRSGGGRGRTRRAPPCPERRRGRVLRDPLAHQERRPAWGRKPRAQARGSLAGADRARGILSSSGFSVLRNRAAEPRGLIGSGP